MSAVCVCKGALEPRGELLERAVSALGLVSPEPAIWTPGGPPPQVLPLQIRGRRHDGSARRLLRGHLLRLSGPLRQDRRRGGKDAHEHREDSFPHRRSPLFVLVTRSANAIAAARAPARPVASSYASSEASACRAVRGQNPAPSRPLPTYLSLPKETHPTCRTLLTADSCAPPHSSEPSLLPGLLAAELPPLIPRDVLFGNPESAQPAALARRQAPGLDRARQEERPAGLGEDRSARTTTRSSPPTRSAASAATSGPRTARRCSTCRTTTATRTSTSSASTSRRGNVRDLTPFQGVRAASSTHRTRASPTRSWSRSTCATAGCIDVYRLNLKTGALDARHREPGRRRRLGAPTPSSRSAPRRSPRPTAAPRCACATTAKSPWRTLVKVGPGGEPRRRRLHRPTASRPT